MQRLIIVILSVYLSAGLQIAFDQTGLIAGLQPLGWLAITLWLSRGEDQEWLAFVYVVAVSCLFGLINNTNMGLLALALAATIIIWQMIRQTISIQMENLGQILLFFNIWGLLWMLFGHDAFDTVQYLSLVIMNSGCSYLVFSIMRVFISRGQKRTVRLR
jgi:hypothetical protein